MNTVTDTRPLPTVLHIVTTHLGRGDKVLTVNAGLDVFQTHGRAFIEVIVFKDNQGRNNETLLLWILMPDGVIHLEKLDANRGTPREQAASVIAECNERMFYQTCESGGLI